VIRNYYLSPSHYAAKWQVRDVSDRHDLELINQKAYACATAQDPALREQLQLEILEAFHGYIIKYFNLIVYGEVPALNTPQGKEAQSFLRLVLPKGTPVNMLTLRKAAKHLHLAFKGCTTSDEVYDTLVAVFLDVFARYDPHYTKKTKEVCDFISSKPADVVLRVDELVGAVAFDPLGCVRVLVRRGYLQSVSGPRKKVHGYRRGPNWPAPASFFEVGPVGFVYFLTKWFRYYLQAWTQAQMSQIESRGNMLDLDAATAVRNQSLFHDDDSFGGDYGAIPHAEGDWVDSRGVRWAADVSMLDHWKTLDLSVMTDNWVKETDDYLFCKLKPADRYLLQLLFVKELSWSELAAAFGVNGETIRSRYRDIMTCLAYRAEARPKSSYRYDLSIPKPLTQEPR
jgi:hypothetical protein